MARFRLIVRRITISHEVIEIAADSVNDATRKGSNYAAEVSNARRGVGIIQTYDEDPNSTVETKVISVRER